MADSPQTRLQLFKLDNCDSTYNYVSNFVGVSVDEYFDNYGTNTNRRYELNNLQYIRKNGIIDIPLIYDIVEDFNYCRYDNGEGRGWEYAFILEKEFINFNMTRVSTQFDVWNNHLDSLKTFRQYVMIDRSSGNFNNINETRTIDLKYEGDVSSQLYYLEPSVSIGIHLVLKDEINNFEDQSAPYSTAFTMDFLFNDDGSNFTNDQSSLSDVIQLINSPITFEASLYVFDFGNMWDKFNENKISRTYEGKTYNGYTIKSPNFSKTNSYTKTYNIRDLYYSDKKLYLYPYTKLRMRSSCNTLDLNIANFNSSISITTYYTFDSSGVTFAHTFTDKFGKYYVLYDYSQKLPQQLTSQELWLSQNRTFGGVWALNAISNACGDIVNLVNTSQTGKISQIKSIDTLKTYASYVDITLSPDTVISNEDISKSRLYILPNHICFEYVYCSDDLASVIESYYNKYGYSYNRMMYFSNRIRTRTKYNYLKTIDFDFPFIYCEDERKELNAILNNGVSIYHYNIDNPLNYGEQELNEYNTYIGG